MGFVGICDLPTCLIISKTAIFLCTESFVFTDQRKGPHTEE